MDGTGGRFVRARREPALELEGEPVTFAPRTLPGHRMLTMRLRNAGGHEVDLYAREMQLLDDAEQSLKASVAFGRAGDASTRHATVSAGDAITIDFVWRARPQAGMPVALQIGEAALNLADLASTAGAEIAASAPRYVTRNE